MEIAASIASMFYLAVLTAVGVWHAKSVHTGEDFALAGRRLPLSVLVGTLIATWIGTGSIFGYAEKAYEHQTIIFILPLAGAAGVLLLAVLAGRARSLPADSVPELLGIRFGRAAQMIGAVALIGAYLIIVSYQYRAGAAIFQYINPVELLGGEPGAWNRTTAILGFATFVILYTVLAGMVSVAWTDLVNGILMAAGILLALGVLAYKAWQMEPGSMPVVAELAQPIAPISALQWIGLLLPTFLLVLGDANLYQRFMSAKSPADARKAALLMFFGILALEWAIIGIACLGRQLLPFEPELHGHTVIAIAFTLLPEWLGVLLVMSIMAVIITTADSFLLGAATSVSTDLSHGLSTAGRQRVVVLFLGLIAIGVSFTSDGFFDVALYAYTLYGASLTPAIVAALTLPNTPPFAVVSGMIAGLAVAAAWKAVAVAGYLPASWMNIDPVLPALGANLILLVSLAAWIRLPSSSRQGD